MEGSLPAGPVWIPLAFTATSLVSLVLLPVLVSRHREEARRTVTEGVTPARTHVGRLQQSLAAEVAAARGYALTSDEAFKTAFREADAAETRSLGELRPLAAHLGPDVVERLSELREAKGRWAASARALIDGQETPSEYAARLRERQALFEQALAASQRLDDGIVAAEGILRERMRRIERWSAIATAALALLALGSAVSVAALARRLGRLARALRYRAQEEKALRRIARALSAAVSVREVVQRVAESAVESTRALGAYVEQVQESHVLVAAAAGEGTPPPGMRVAYPGSLTRAMIEAVEPAIVSEIGAVGEAMAPHVRARCPRCAALLVPLVSEGQILGALVLLRGAREGSFEAAEAAHARALGDLASAALRRVLLLEQTERERRLKTALLDSAGEGIYGLDEHARCTFVNTTAAQMLGYEPAELLGRNMHRLVHGKRADGSPYPPQECPINKTLRSGERVRVEGEALWRKDGRSFLVEYSASPMVEGEVSGAVVAFSDITARKRAEEEREALLQREREARAEAEAAVRAREEVLAIVSHDLRNPLNSILGNASLLLQMSLDEEQRVRQLQVIRRSAERMNRLIQDLLDVARLHAGQKLILEAQPLDLAPVATEACESFQPQVQQKSQRLECRVANDLPAVRADRDRLLQVLSNLIGNAVKFTPEGGRIVVEATPVDGEMRLTVADSGPGIPPENLERVFDPYWQARTTARLGAGLGLPIAKGVVESHGGRIWVESRPGEGATFTFTLPLAEISQAVHG
ncbi:MAG TPA: ATP-binding protein [Vicinamibacteria bacterium]